jgi:hypothetical protein
MVADSVVLLFEVLSSVTVKSLGVLSYLINDSLSTWW